MTTKQRAAAIAAAILTSLKISLAHGALTADNLASVAHVAGSSVVRASREVALVSGALTVDDLADAARSSVLASLEIALEHGALTAANLQDVARAAACNAAQSLAVDDDDDQ